MIVTGKTVIDPVILSSIKTRFMEYTNKNAAGILSGF